MTEKRRGSAMTELSSPNPETEVDEDIEGVDLQIESENFKFVNKFKTFSGKSRRTS